MRVWKGRIDDCLIAPNRTLYYTYGEKIGMVQSDGNATKLAFEDGDSKYGPLDFVRVSSDFDEKVPALFADMVGYAGLYHWCGWGHEHLSRCYGYGGRRFPIGGYAWLLSDQAHVGIELTNTGDRFPIQIHQPHKLYEDATTPHYIFDDEWLLVALRLSERYESRYEIVRVSRRDLRRLVRMAPFGMSSRLTARVYRWTRNWLILHQDTHDSNYVGMRPDGSTAKVTLHGRDTLYTFTPSGAPVYSKYRQHGIFVGEGDSERHIDFELGGPTRGAAVSDDGLTAAYWTVKAVVQFDLE